MYFWNGQSLSMMILPFSPRGDVFSAHSAYSRLNRSLIFRLNKACGYICVGRNYARRAAVFTRVVSRIKNNFSQTTRTEVLPTKVLRDYRYFREMIVQLRLVYLFASYSAKIHTAFRHRRDPACGERDRVSYFKLGDCRHPTYSLEVLHCGPCSRLFLRETRDQSIFPARAAPRETQTRK